MKSKRLVKMEEAIVNIDSDSGKFEMVLRPGSAKELGDGFAAIAKYLKSANHAKHGLNNIRLTYNWAIST